MDTTVSSQIHNRSQSLQIPSLRGSWETLRVPLAVKVSFSSSDFIVQPEVLLAVSADISRNTSSWS